MQFGTPVKPRRISLTGGIATGKSTIAGMFAERGALVLDADKVAREVVEPATECSRRLEDFLGSDYFVEGRLNRPKLRERIIKDEECRSRVESILHPCIISEMERQWREATRLDPDRIVIFDIPLLFEVGLEKNFDIVILAYAPADIQIRRLAARDGVSAEQAERTLTIQLPIEVKRSRSHVVIDNSRDPERTRIQVESIWNALKKGACH
jgi:dephospho-CoA kinase